MADEQGFDPTQYGATAVEDTPQPFDPTQHGAIPVEEKPRGIGEIASDIGHAALTQLQQITGLHRPTSLKEVVQEIYPTEFGKTLVGGMLANTANLVKTGIEAAQKPAFSKEGIEFGANVAGQAGGQLLGLLGLKGAGEVPTLREQFQGKSEPATPMEAAVEPVPNEPIVTPPNQPTGIGQTRIEPSAAQAADQNLTQQFTDLRTQAEDIQSRINAQREAQPVPAAAEVTANVLGKQEPVAPPTAAGTGGVPSFAAKYNPDTFLNPPRWTDENPVLQNALFDVARSKDAFTGKDITGAWNKMDSGQRQDLIERGFSVSTDRNNKVILTLSGDALPTRNYFKMQETRQAPSVPSAVETTTAKTSQEISTGSGIQETGGAAPLSTETPKSGITIDEARTVYDEAVAESKMTDAEMAAHRGMSEAYQEKYPYAAEYNIKHAKEVADIPFEEHLNKLRKSNKLIEPTEGEPNASQEPSTTSVTQPEVRTQVGEGTPLRQQGETPETRQGTEAGTQTTQDVVAPEIPEGSKATVKVKDTNGDTVEVPNQDAKEWADKFTKERDSYKALIDCLGR